jgi:MFS family permease
MRSPAARRPRLPSHPNDGRASEASIQSRRISRQEVTFVCLAGAIVGVYDGAFTITFSFSPILLVAEGMAVGAAGFLVGSATWLVVASVQAGGIIVQRWGRPNPLMLAGVIVWSVCLLLLPLADPRGHPDRARPFSGSAGRGDTPLMFA